MQPTLRTPQALLYAPIPSSKVTQYPADVPRASAPPRVDLLAGGCATRGKGVAQQQGMALQISLVGMPATGGVRV